MILRTDDIKAAASLIAQAVDSNEISQITGALELITVDGRLRMNTTNGEYYVSVDLGATDDPQFHATVGATLFLKLISQITTEAIELECKETNLCVKANGKYKFPLIYDGDELLVLPKIVIENPIVEMPVSKDILMSILNYNTKVLNIGAVSNPIQKMYYIDELGALTFTTSACINSFKLSKPVKLLLVPKVVKLFKLFNTPSVNLSVGKDTQGNGLTVSKMSLKNELVEVTIALSTGEDLIDMVPAEGIRARAFDTYPHVVEVSKNDFIQTINRILLFNSGNLKSYASFTFDNDGVVVADMDNDNTESVFYKNSVTSFTDKYSMMLDLNELKVNLDGITEPTFTISFGNEEAAVFKHGNVYNVVPEVSSME